MMAVSQDHRMAKRRFTSPNPCPRKDPQSRVSRPMRRSEGFQRGDPQSLGSLCQCTATHTAQEFFLTFRGNLPSSSLYLLPLVQELGITEMSLAPSSLHSPFRYFICTDETPHEPFPGRTSQLPQPFFTGKYSSPLPTVVALCWTLYSTAHVSLYWVHGGGG